MKHQTSPNPGRSGKLLPLVLLALLAAIGLSISFNLRPVASDDRITAQVAGRAMPYFNLQDGQDVATELESERGGLFVQQRAAGRPLALAQGDFDEDGAPDLLSAYGSTAGGELLLHRGNPEAISPQSEEALNGILNGKFPAPFRKKARSFGIAEAPDFLGIGDFNRDGHKDAVAAALGSDSIFVLDGDGKGKFGEARRLTVPGQITAMMTGEFNQPDGLNDLLVAVNGPDGPQILVFDGASGAWPVISAAYRMPAEVSAMAVGALDEEVPLDLAAAAGNSIFIIRGRTNDQLAAQAGKLTDDIEEIRVEGGARALTVGPFVWDRGQQNEIAVMTGGGEVQILGRAGLDTRPYSEAEEARILKTVNRRGIDPQIIHEDLRRLIRELTAPAGDAKGWQVIETHALNAAPPSRANAQSLMFATRLSGADTADLVVADAANDKLHFIMDGLERQTTKDERQKMGRRPRQPILFDVEVEGGPVAALSMKVSVDTQPDIVLLREGASQPTAMLVLPNATFNVTNTGDVTGTGAATLRNAVRNANNSPGADLIVLPAGTYTLSLTPADDDIGAGTGNNINAGDLDVLDTDGNGVKDGNLTITGAGSGTTIIQWAAANTDRIFDVDADPFGFNGGTGLDLSISGVTLRNGFAPGLDPGGPGPPPPFLTEGGAIRHLGFNSTLPGADGKLTITNCVIQNSIASGPGGGIFTIHSAMELSGTTISGNRSDFENGGGIFHGGGTSPNAIALTVTNSTITGNTAEINVQDGNSGGRGGGAVVLATVEKANHTITFTNTSVQNNTAESFGGGIDFEVGSSLVISGGLITGNKANTNGGGIFTSAGAGASPGTVTFTNVSVQNNTADFDNNGTGDGGGIYHDRGTFNLSGGTISGNTANNGGGIFDTLSEGTPSDDVLTLSNVTISGNNAKASGGGIYSEDGPGTDVNVTTLSGVTLVNNKADSDNNNSGDGGGLFVESGTVNVQTGTIIGNTGQSNTAVNGGGIAIIGGTLNVAAGATIRNNTATVSGGGVFVNGGASTFTGLIQIINNSAANGGGVAVNNGTATLTEINFTGNSATNGGGAVRVSGGTLTMTFSRIVANTVVSGARGVHQTGGTANAENNWWGCNDPPASGTGCDNTVGTVDADPRLVLTHTANPATILRGGCTTTLTASFLVNSAGTPVAVANLDPLIGLPVTFSNAVLGTISNPQSTIQATGTATATFTSGANGGNGSANARVDNGTATAAITIQEPPTITCPANIAVNNDPGVCGASVPLSATTTGFPAPTVTFKIGATTITSPHVFPIGTTTVTATASNGVRPDATCSSPGTAPDPSCTFTVTVTDIEDPVITCPAPITQSTDPGTCSAVVNFSVTATDNCPNVTVVSTPASGTTFPLGTTTVTSTATDVNGRTATCSFTVTVQDQTPPTVTCPAPITQSTDPGQCSAIVNFTPTATDNCPGTVNIVSSPASGSAFPKGVTTVTVTATDAQGNTANCTFTVTVNDTEAPAITCPAPITQSTDPGQCSAVVTFTASATDNCPGVTVVSNPPSGSTFPKGTTTVTSTATDTAGNTSSCTFTVTVNDTEDPVITCPSPITVNNDPGACNAIVNYTVSATDNCPGVTFTATPASGTAFPLGTTTVNATATDAAGNTKSCSFTVTVNDTTPPTVTCPSPITVNNDPGQCSAVVNFNVTGTDNCPGTVDIVSTPASGSVFPVGTTTVTSTATDAQGNTASCTFTVTVNDTTPPTVTCPAPITTTTSPGVCGAIVNFTVNGSDNCSGVMVTSTPASGTTFPLGTTTVTATATDGAGNTANCSFTVTVVDQTPPQITCPAPLTVMTDQGQPSAVVMFTVNATDECPGVTVVSNPPSGSTFPIGTTTVNSTATDAAGNTANCSFTVTVVDQSPPTITCPAPISVGNDVGGCSAIVNFTVTATDNAPGVTVVSNPPSGSAFPVGVTTVTSTATDASGNTASCSFTVTVNDVQPPQINCPTPISVSADTTMCSAVVNFSVTAADNCPGVTVVSNPPSGSTFPIGTTTVTSTATDASGNTSSCSFTVTVTDATAPVINCPAPIMVNNAPGQCSAVVNFNVTATDNCSGSATPVVSPPSGSTFPVGVTTVTATATDAAGNTANCTFTVTVTDSQPPQISCPAPITVPNDPNQCSAVVNFTVNGSDNCSGVTVVSNPPSGSTFPKGTTTVTSTVTDASGNTASCSFTVTVNDVQPPTLNCPMPIMVSAATGQCSAVVNYAVTAVDNCPGGSLVVSPPSGSTFPVGVTTVTATATDAVGNTSSCMFTVTVVDTQPPQISCPSNITGPPGVVTFPNATATDNCPGVTVVSNPPSGSIFPVGATTVTMTATDASGNTATCTFLVTTFDICLQDDSDPNKVLLFDSNTGDFLFCCNGQTISGRGRVTKKGCAVMLREATNDRQRRINVTVETCQKRGTAVLQMPVGTMFCQITDRNTANNSCQCSASAPSTADKKKKKNK